MKKFISIAIMLVMLFSFAACGQKQLGPGAYVTIMTKDGAQVASQFVEFVDYDKDGKNTIDELLKAAHEKYAPNKANDYESADLGYGLTITKLWGDESMSYGYYLNNTMAWSAADPVAENDYLCAFVYKDGSGFSDVYAWFDKYIAEGSDVSLNLQAYTYDESWNAIAVTMPNIRVMVDYNAVDGLITDNDGNVKITGLKKGEHIITVMDTENNIFNGACCRVTVK